MPSLTRMRDMSINTKKCLICNNGKKNDVIYAHKDPETGEIWFWCQGKCKRGYSLYEYCSIAGISLRDFLKSNLSFEEARPLEVNAMSWPRSFHALSDPVSQPALAYLASRGLSNPGEMYYDSAREGIVFPYYLDNTFVGAQVRFIKSRLDEDGNQWKITTLPGTRLGYLFWGWSQQPLGTNVKYVIVAEGAINAASLQQALNQKYGNLLKNPYRCISTSGASITKYHSKKLRELIESGLKVISAFDNDEPGIKAFERMAKDGACTHYAFVEEDGKDWNDLLRFKDANLASYFASRLRKA